MTEAVAAVVTLSWPATAVVVYFRAGRRSVLLSMAYALFADSLIGLHAALIGVAMAELVGPWWGIAATVVAWPVTALVSLHVAAEVERYAIPIPPPREG